MDVYFTLNSVYEVDLEGKRYRRSPKGVEQDVESHRLGYGEWLPLKDVECPVRIVPSPFQPFRAPETRDLVLHILHETSEAGIYTSALVGAGFTERLDG